MNYAVIISIILVFFLGFAFIDKICCIAFQLNTPEAKDICDSEIKNEKALIFGNQQISLNIVKLLEKYDIASISIHDINELNMSDSYSYLFAVDDRDFENLMICSICSKKMGIKKIISVCNYHYNKKIFEDYQIKYLLKADEIAAQLVFSLLDTKNGGIKNVHN